MADETLPDAATAAVCSWCSAALPAPDLDHCPTCGAILTGDVAEPVPGITTVDHTAVLRGAPTTVRPRNRLLSWISGDYPEETQSPTEARALEPPDLAVKREIARLELESEVANLKAQADALVAEAAAEGRVVELPDMSALSGEGLAAAEAALLSDEDADETAEAVDDGNAQVVTADAVDGAADARSDVADAADAAASETVADAADPAADRPPA